MRIKLASTERSKQRRVVALKFLIKTQALPKTGDRTNSQRVLMVWQRVRDSNPCTGLERALIYSRKIFIFSGLWVTIFPVALLLLNAETFDKVLVGSNRTVRVKIVSRSKGVSTVCQSLLVAANRFGFYQE
jgi:hypothetical protein